MGLPRIVLFSLLARCCPRFLQHHGAALFTLACPCSPRHVDSACQNQRRSRGYESTNFQDCRYAVFWKVICFFTAFVPKTLIWVCTTCLGFHYIMETAEIVEQVLGCMSMIFILGIDEMIMSTLTTSATKHIMGSIVFFSVFKENEEVPARPRPIGRNTVFSSLFWCILLPKRALLVVVILCIFLARYYYDHRHWE